MTNHIFKLKKSFEEFYAWLMFGSGWIIELIQSQYINISTYRPLSRSSNMNLAIESEIPRKGLININNEDKKMFFIMSC